MVQILQVMLHQQLILFLFWLNLKYLEQEATQTVLNKITKYNISIIKMVIQELDTNIHPLAQLRTGGCVLFVRPSRTLSALSTLRGVRTSTLLAFRLGSPRPSACKLLCSSLTSLFKAKAENEMWG